MLEHQHISYIRSKKNLFGIIFNSFKINWGFFWRLRSYFSSFFFPTNSLLSYLVVLCIKYNILEKILLLYFGTTIFMSIDDILFFGSVPSKGHNNWCFSSIFFTLYITFHVGISLKPLSSGSYLFCLKMGKRDVLGTCHQILTLLIVLLAISTTIRLCQKK